MTPPNGNNLCLPGCLGITTLVSSCCGVDYEGRPGNPTTSGVIGSPSEQEALLAPCMLCDLLQPYFVCRVIVLLYYP